jgi:hypothetical protein
MNRPAKFGNRLYHTEQELGERQKEIEKQHENDLVGTGPPSHWGERPRRPCEQISTVVDPSDGQTPALVPDAVLGWPENPPQTTIQKPTRGKTSAITSARSTEAWSALYTR